MQNDTPIQAATGGPGQDAISGLDRGQVKHLVTLERRGLNGNAYMVAAKVDEPS